MDAALRLPPKDGLRPWTYYCLFGLLPVTGLRIPNAGECGGCSKVNREVFKSEQTAFLAVAYHVGEEVKGLSCGPVLQLDP